MVDILNFMWVIPFCLCVGFVFGETSAEWNRKKAEIKETRKEEYFFVDEKDPIMLRNGFGITRDDFPSIAEQWVNMMNFNGENQKEEDYAEEENSGSEEDLGRIS